MLDQFFILNANNISFLSHPSAEEPGSGGTTLGQQAMAHTTVKTPLIVQSAFSGNGFKYVLLF